MRTKKLLFILALLCAMVQTSWAQNFNVWDGVSEEPPRIFINSETVKNVFIDNAAQLVYLRNHWTDVAGGYYHGEEPDVHYTDVDYDECNIYLDADLDMSAANWEPLPAPGHKFDGRGHTIRIKIDGATADNQGLFKEIASGGELTNLHVTGNIHCANSCLVGGICGENNGTIRNCWVSADVRSDWSGSGYAKVGGIAGQNDGLIEFCCMTGNVTNYDDNVGGLVGDNSGDIVRHCTFYGTLNINSSMANENKYAGDSGTEEDCYDTYYDVHYNYARRSSMGMYQNAYKYPYTVSFSQSGPGVATINLNKAYPDQTIMVNNTMGVVQSITVKTVDGDDVFSSTSSGNAYTIAMPRRNAVVTVVYRELLLQEHAGTEADPYQIVSSDMWDEFVYWVNNGNDFKDKFVKLAGNITITRPAGLREDKPFSGTFLGNGKTITAAITDNANSGAAPFRYIKNATIKVLTVAGTIASNQVHTAGLVGFADGTNTIEGCTVSATLNISSNYAGGIIGHGLSSATTIKDCVFAGTINGVDAERANIGGIWGWGESASPTLNNCLENGTYTNISSMHPMGLMGGSGSITNCYTVNSQIGEPSRVCTVNGGRLVSTTTPVDGFYKPQTLVDGNNYYVIYQLVGVEESYGANASTPANITPALTATDGSGLTFGTDFTVTLNGEPVSQLPISITKTGSYSLTVDGIGGCVGSETVNFIMQGDLYGSGTEADPYLIRSTFEWDSFAKLVKEGTRFSDQFVKLENDITISTMVGEREEYPFSGTFLGGGHTLTADISNINSKYGGIAPFFYIKDATIQNVKVAGTISSNSYHTAGLVGFADGTNTIEGCTVSATLNISNDYAGGIVGHGLTSATTIKDCIFDGTVNGVGGNRANVGGIWGWSNSGTPVLQNCLEKGTYTNISSMHPIGLQKAAGSISNSYYMTPQIGSPTNACTVSGFAQVYTTVPSGDFSCLLHLVDGNDYYMSCTYGGVEESYDLRTTTVNITPTLTGADGTKFVFGTDFTVQFNDADVTTLPISILENGTYTLSITAKGNCAGSKTVSIRVEGGLQGNGSAQSPYIINNNQDWEDFALSVRNGIDFKGQYVRLDADISVTTKCGTVSGSKQVNAFSGTFLGNNKTITATITDTDNQGTALFCYINGATIKDLTVAGTITGGIHAAALVGFANGWGNRIEGCVATANVSGGSHIGGLLGHSLNSTTIVSGCVFSGMMTGGSTAKGAIIGWGDDGGTNNVIDCLYLMAGGQNTECLDLVRLNEETVSVENSYKTTDSGSYGKPVRRVLAGEHVTIDAADGDGSSRTTYSGSGIIAYLKGISYDGTFYCGDGDKVSLTLSNTASEPASGYSYGYVASAGKLIGTANPYTLIMPDEDVTINIETVLDDWATTSSGDAFLIYNAAQFDLLAQRVNNGNTYRYETFKLMNDITVTTMVGNSEKNSFWGTFDGNGHKITVTYNTSEEHTAPFRFVNCAQIKNLTVDGTIITNQKYAGGIVAESYGSLRLTNCRSSVIISSTVNGEGTHGGLVAKLNGWSNNININGCVFDGILATTTGTTLCGGFIGWADNNRPDITNSLMKPASVSSGMLANTFTRWHDEYEPTITNCFYVTTNNLPTDQGITGRTYTTAQAGLGSIEEECGMVTAYTNGIFCDGTYYVGPSLAGTGTEKDPYLISDATDWNYFAEFVSQGHTYSDEYVRLVNDITITTMAGSSDTNSFWGHFDGNGKTLTLNYGTETERIDEDYCAPFRYIRYADIHDLNVGGTIYTQSKFAAGIAGRVRGVNSITNCHVSTVIDSSVNGDGTHGGLVAHIQNGTTNISNGLFDGSMTGSNTTYCGGIVGYIDSNSIAVSVTLDHCIFAPASLAVNTDGCATLVRGGSPTITSCYYTETMGDAQGIQLYKNESDVSGDGLYMTLTVGTTQYYARVNVSMDERFAVTGDVIHPQPTVTIPDGTEIPAENYTLTYSADDDRAEGDYTLTITATVSGGSPAEFSPYLKGSKTLDYKVYDPNKLEEDGQGGYYVLMPDMVEDWNQDKGAAVRTYNLPAGITTFKVYDRGGKDGDYSNKYFGKLTLTAPEGYRLRVSGSCKIAGSYDGFYVYDDVQLAVRMTGSGDGSRCEVLEPYESEGRSLTLVFKTDDSVVSDGLDLTVDLISTDMPWGIAADANSTEADVTWEGTADSYTVKYRKAATEQTLYSVSFDEDGLPKGWQAVDSDGDDHNWYWYANSDDAHSGDGCVASDSYDEDGNSGALTPDNWLISPELSLSGTLKFWVRAFDPSYTTEHFAIYASTTGSAVSDFTAAPLMEKTLQSSVWREYTVDLSSFGGTKGYIAIRHFNCTNQYSLLIDDFSIVEPADAAGAWQTLAATTEKQATITGLEPNTAYDVQVIGTKGDDSYESAIETFSTLEAITLANSTDNTDVIAGAAGKTADVTLAGRTLYKDGSWNTLCLPFSVDNFTGTPLEDATVKTLASTSFSDGTLTMNFSDDQTSIEAGKPYIVKWDKADDYVDDDAHNIVNPVFNGVTISNATANAETSYVDFVGTYSPVSIYTDEKTNLYLGADNKLYYPTATDFQVNAFRGYFQLKGLTAGEPSNSNQASVRAFKLNFGDDEATGIISVHDSGFMVNGSDMWYTLDGHKLQGKPTQRGIYINNGKKVAIK